MPSGDGMANSNVASQSCGQFAAGLLIRQDRDAIRPIWLALQTNLAVEVVINCQLVC
jgi:hypothetical protein